MGLIEVLFGRPLASSEDEGERISPMQGIPTFGLDALSSAAYGPGTAFIAPTYLFVGTLVIVILVGLYKVVASGGHPVPMVSLPRAETGQASSLSSLSSLKMIGIWILVKAFASGCTALTGVEAVSN